ncbi:hypothetical protein [Halarchaeum sp. P4]|uniref:hypothetical protein n=1 Tax=Halarchaeum sp. P4 TaxID=3421639 RepID=UPI003EBE7838
MRTRTIGYATAAGIATFLVVFVAVSEVLLPYVEFSVLVGIPAGLVAGALAAAFVLSQIGQEDSPTRRNLAKALGTFGVVLLVVFVLGVVLRVGNTISLVAAAIIGVLAGAGVFVLSRE